MQWSSGSPVCILKGPSRPGANAWMLAPVGAGYCGWEGPSSLGAGGGGGIQTTRRAWWAQDRQRQNLRSLQTLSPHWQLWAS